MKWQTEKMCNDCPFARTGPGAHLRRNPSFCPTPMWLSLWIWILLGTASAYAQTGILVNDSVHSTALEKNLLGDSPERNVRVYLPPSYTKSEHVRYPVIYLLHGFLGTNESWGRGGNANIPQIMDRLISSGSLREMIVVMPDGNNKYGGSFYTNSTATGNWEDFLSHDLIEYVDRKYRTLSQASSRGIAGHSMGGYGALKLAMKHPDIYSAVYGLSACCLDWGTDLSLANPAWDRTLAFKSFEDFRQTENQFFRRREEPRSTASFARMRELFYSIVFLALSAAWSPNANSPPLYASFPVAQRNGTRDVVVVEKAKWSANMPVAMVSPYRSNILGLRAVAFDVGLQDEFPHIVTGARALSQVLTENGIQYQFEEYEGNHDNRIAERIETRLLPFFSEKLVFETGLIRRRSAREK